MEPVPFSMNFSQNFRSWRLNQEAQKTRRRSGRPRRLPWRGGKGEIRDLWAGGGRDRRPATSWEGGPWELGGGAGASRAKAARRSSAAVEEAATSLRSRRSTPSLRVSSAELIWPSFSSKSR